MTLTVTLCTCAVTYGMRLHLPVAEDAAVPQAQTLVLTLPEVGDLHHSQHIAVPETEVLHYHPETTPCRPEVTGSVVSSRGHVLTPQHGSESVIQA